MAIDPFAHCNLDPNFETSQCTWDTCCLAQSAFYYLPNYGANIFFAVLFGVILLPQLGLGIFYRTWGFMVGMLLGLALEVVGYAARVELHGFPWDKNQFLIYLICLTIAPVFISASIYLSLARIIAVYGRDVSRLAPRTLALVFIASDFASLVLQAIGGGMADTSNDVATGNTGRWVMVAGLLLQAISLAVFLLLSLDFFLLLGRRRGAALDPTPARARLRASLHFRLFLAALFLAVAAILARSVFRVAELWGGFRGDLWNNETDFLVLDGAMMALAALLLTLLHPGPAFAGEWRTSGWRFGESNPRQPTGKATESGYAS